MKKRLLIACATLFSTFGFSQTTATNFTANDCNNISHDLFTELNSGKVIVLCWVMPCLTCVNPAKTAYDAVQSYATSNPNKVFMYLCDDDGGTPCSTINTWATQYAMPNTIKCSNPVIAMTDYGYEGMPKIVILGGWNHTVFYNEINGENLSGIQPAINQALISSGLEENNNSISELAIYSNPLINNISIVYSLNKAGSVIIEIFDIAGKSIKTHSFTNQAQGKHEVLIDYLPYSNGMYFLKLHTNGISKTIKFVITY